MFDVSTPTMAPVAEEEPFARKPRRNLTPSQWAEIEMSYELGKTTAAELSEKYGVTPQALSKHFKEKGIVKGSRVEAVKEEAAKTVVEKVAEKVVEFEQKRHDRIEQTKEQSYNDAVVMRQLALKKIQASLASGATSLSIKELREIHDVLINVRKERWAILNIGGDDDEGELPELPISKMTDEEIEEKRAEQEQDGGIPRIARLIH